MCHHHYYKKTGISLDGEPVYELVQDQDTELLNERRSRLYKDLVDLSEESLLSLLNTQVKVKEYADFYIECIQKILKERKTKEKENKDSLKNIKQISEMLENCKYFDVFQLEEHLQLHKNIVTALEEYLCGKRRTESKS